MSDEYTVKIHYKSEDHEIVKANNKEEALIKAEQKFNIHTESKNVFGQIVNRNIINMEILRKEEPFTQEEETIEMTDIKYSNPNRYN